MRISDWSSDVCSSDLRVQNDRIVLQKFDKYYDAKNFSFDKVTFFAIPDSTVRLSNLRSGGIDILERANPSDVPSIKQDDSLAFKPVTGLGFRQFMFNVRNGERSEEHTSELQSLMRIS